jgi:hypothetical protein
MTRILAELQCGSIDRSRRLSLEFLYLIWSARMAVSTLGKGVRWEIFEREAASSANNGRIALCGEPAPGRAAPLSSPPFATPFVGPFEGWQERLVNPVSLTLFDRAGLDRISANT